MMSKKNSQEILDQASDSCYHYALRKLSVGVASVLIGTTMYVGLAHADTVATSNEPAPIAQAMTPTTVQSANADIVTSSAIVQSPLSRSSVNNVSNEAQSNSSQQASNVAQNNNALAYSQEQQTSSFNVRNNGVNNATLYNDNKVSQQSVSNQAENAQLDLYHWNIAGQAYDDPSKINNGNPLPWGRVIYFSLRGSFDLTEAQLKSTQLINIGTLKCSQSPVNIYPDTFRFNINHFALKTSDGATVGEYLMTPEYLAVRLDGTYKGTGSQHFVISDVGGEDGYLASTRKFRGYGAVPTTVTYQVGTHVYYVKVAAPGVPDLVTQDGVPEQVAHGWTYGESKFANDIQFVWDSASRLNSSQLQEWVKSGGMSIGNMPYPDSDKPFEYVFRLSGDDTITPSLIHVEKRANALDSQGRMHNDHGAYFANAYGGNVKNPLDDEYVIDNAGDGLSLNQLKQMKSNNVSGALIYWSRQSDGSALVYVKMPVSDMKIKNFDMLRSALNDSPTINLDSDPDKAIENTINYYKNRNVMGGYPFSTNWVLWCTRSDDTKDTRTAVTYYDPETGKVLNQNPIMAIWKANKTFVKGQSTVKLHVVSSNGAALQQVKSFTDWPDQNKHASLMIPSITGYHLVTNPQSVLSTLHLSGTAISTATQASYPDENTVADYYAVMAPDAETVKVNVVDTDTSSILSSYTLSGLYGSTIQSTSALSTDLQALLASGKYDLVSNPLTSLPKYSTTNNPITISLKHHIDSTQRHYRVIEDLPDGTKKVIIDMEAMLYKDAARNYYEDYGAWTKDGKLLKHNEVKLLKQTNILDNPGSAMDYVNATVDSVTGYRHYIDRSVYPYYGDYYGGLGVWGDNSTVWMDLFRRGDPHDGVGFATNIFPSTDFHIVYAPKDEAATVNIIDVDENNKVLSTGTVTGKFNTQIVTNDDVQAKLKSLLDTGHYVLQSNGFDQAAKYQDGTNTITIALKHKIDSTQRHYRVIEDLPDGTKKVIVDYQITFYKDAASKYYNRMGAVTVDTLKLLKPNNVQMSVGQYSFPNDNTSVYSAIDEVPGYSYQMIDGINFNSYPHGVNCRIWTNSQMAPFPPTTFNKADFKDLVIFDLFLGGSNDGGTDLVSNLQNIGCVENPLASRDFHITYSRRSYPITVNYYDLSGALISSSKSQHLFGDSVDVAPSIPANYVFAPGQSTHLTVSYNSSDNELDLVVIPRVTVSTDSRTVARTIQITRPDGTVQSVVQSVQFARPAYFNVVTNSIQYGSWMSPVSYFTQYIPVSISGYVSPTVASQQTTPDSQSLVVRVSYTPIKLPQIPPYIDAAGHSYTSLPAGYHVVVGQFASSVHASVLIAPDAVPIVPVSLQYVTRTVTIMLPNGRQRVIHQRVRKGTRFGKVAIPKLHGYKVVISGDSQELGPTSAERDINMSVQFVKM